MPRKKRYLKFLLGLAIAIGLFLCVLISLKGKTFIISKDLSQSEIIPSGSTLIFTGDIMLGRNVKKAINQYGQLSIFKDVQGIFKSKDIIIGNLEGPIIKDAPIIPPGSMKFGFDPEALEILTSLNFKVLSLSNNHTLDQGKSGYDQTIKYLNDNSLEPIGDNVRCGKDTDYYLKDKVAIIAGNFTYSSTLNNCLDKTMSLIQGIKQENADAFIVVYPHWGEEYQVINSNKQKELAHKFIDNGADMVIGSHPHVVQNIELYNNKLIVYSLGNFIFDQYFSEDTQQGLVIQLDLIDKGLVVGLIPIQGDKSKLSLMPKDKEETFLDELAQRSSEGLAKGIKANQIVLSR